jgi:hypothetical protein
MKAVASNRSVGNWRRAVCKIFHLSQAVRRRHAAARLHLFARRLKQPRLTDVCQTAWAVLVFNWHLDSNVAPDADHIRTWAYGTTTNRFHPYDSWPRHHCFHGDKVGFNFAVSSPLNSFEDFDAQGRKWNNRRMDS